MKKRKKGFWKKEGMKVVEYGVNLALPSINTSFDKP